MIRTRVRWTLGLLGFLAIPARAAIPAMSFSDGASVFGVSLGLAVPTPTNRFNRVAKSGPAFSLSYLHYPLDWLGLGLEFDALKFGKAGLSGPDFYLPPYGAGSSASATDIGLSMLLRLNLISGQSWTPYLLGGGGFHRFFGQVQDARSTSKPACTALAATAGAGIEIFFLRNVSGFFELRYHDLELRRSFQAGSAEVMAYKLGVNYWF